MASPADPLARAPKTLMFRIIFLVIGLDVLGYDLYYHIYQKVRTESLSFIFLIFFFWKTFVKKWKDGKANHWNRWQLTSWYFSMLFFLFIVTVATSWLLIRQCCASLSLSLWWISSCSMEKKLSNGTPWTIHNWLRRRNVLATCTIVYPLFSFLSRGVSQLTGSGGTRTTLIFNEKENTPKSISLLLAGV